MRCLFLIRMPHLQHQNIEDAMVSYLNSFDAKIIFLCNLALANFSANFGQNGGVVAEFCAVPHVRYVATVVLPV